MKNITVSIDEDTYRARMRAAKHGTCVSALFGRFLIELASAESAAERVKQDERKLRARHRLQRRRPLAEGGGARAPRMIVPSPSHARGKLAAASRAPAITPRSVMGRVMSRTDVEGAVGDQRVL
ncbi:MAG TPA: hypothetical protein VKP67_24610 [Xanthobacteraceae bacterium]|nr:hypothetical protein [Xanthobacteraceae bacterium]